jgi:hypothetical protein
MNKFAANFLLFLVVITGLLILPGCAKNSLGTIKVSGTVTLDGKPADGVAVAFYPKAEGGRECFGITDAQGRFVLTVSGAEVGSGAVPGEYIPGFFKEQSPTRGMSEEEVRKKFPRGLPEPIDLLPTKYADRTKTDIAPVKVEKGKKNDFAFDLLSK